MTVKISQHRTRRNHNAEVGRGLNLAAVRLSSVYRYSVGYKDKA